MALDGIYLNCHNSNNSLLSYTYSTHRLSFWPTYIMTLISLFKDFKFRILLQKCKWDFCLKKNDELLTFCVESGVHNATFYKENLIGMYGTAREEDSYAIVDATWVCFAVRCSSGNKMGGTYLASQKENSCDLGEGKSASTVWEWGFCQVL